RLCATLLRDDVVLRLLCYVSCLPAPPTFRPTAPRQPATIGRHPPRAVGRRAGARAAAHAGALALRRAREHRATKRDHQSHRERAGPPDLCAVGPDRPDHRRPAARPERARREARRARAAPRRHLEARGAVRVPGAARGGELRRPAGAITTADLGQLDWPVQGRIVYQFGTATGPNNTRLPWHGIGIAAPAGTPVRSIAGGTVSLAGPLGTYLKSVLVDHGGGYYSFYGYLNDATVAKGERVTKGQILGHVGGGSK